jgi:hypothetical protein
LEAIVEPEPGCAERRVAIIGQGTAHGQTVRPRGLGRRIGAGFQLPFERADAPDVLLELLLGMAIGFIDRFGGFAEVVKLAQLVGNARQRRPDGAANGVLAVGEHRPDGHGQGLLHFAQQGGEILLRRTEETTGQQHLAGQAVPQEPDDLMADIRLQAIEREQHAPLLAQALPEAALIGQLQRQQFVVALHEVCHGALGDIDPAGAERLMELRDRAMGRVALAPEPGHDVEAELAMGERPPTLFFRPIGPVIERAGAGCTAPDLGREVDQPVQRRDGARVVIGDPQRPTTPLTAGTQRLQQPVDGRSEVALALGHNGPPR